MTRTRFVDLRTEVVNFWAEESSVAAFEAWQHELAVDLVVVRFCRAYVDAVYRHVDFPGRFADGDWETCVVAHCAYLLAFPDRVGGRAVAVETAQ